MAAAAYRVGVELVDERTGLVHDYTRRSGVVSAEVVLSDGGTADRSVLWNAAESAEKRKDGRTAREWVIALPAELDASQRGALAREFAVELARRFRVAADVAVHAPDRGGDGRNHHAHILCTTRRVTRQSGGALAFGAKATIELGDKDRKKAGISGKAADEIADLREIWAGMVNDALQRSGSAERVDHRSLSAQREDALAAGDQVAADALDREPAVHIGVVATGIDRKGVEQSRRGEDHEARLERNRQRNVLRQQARADIAEIEAEIRELEAAEAMGGTRADRPSPGLIGRYMNKSPSAAGRPLADMKQDLAAETKKPVHHDGPLLSRFPKKKVEADAPKRPPPIDQAAAEAAAEAARVKRQRENWERYEASKNGWSAGDDEPDSKADEWYNRRMGWLERRYQDGDLLRRLDERGIHIDWITFSKAGDPCAQLRMKVGTTTVVDDGKSLNTDNGRDDQAILLMVEIAKAKGWKSVNVRGDQEFVRKSIIAMEEAGLRVARINGVQVDEDGQPVPIDEDGRPVPKKPIGPGM